MFRFEFKERAAREVEKLPSPTRKRILEKLKFYATQENPLKFAAKLQDSRFGEYRFRIGNYRVLFDVRDHTIIILKVEHRRDIYKR